MKFLGGPAMSEPNNTTGSDLFTLALAGLLPGYSQLSVKIATPSGREFQYEISQYTISPGLTPDGALALARRIFRDKYRYSEWDRQHPHVDVEQEIVTRLTAVILRESEKVGQWLV